MSPRFQPSRAWSMARKELRHVLRDPFTLGWAFGLPILLVIFFGYAIDFNVRDVHLATADRDQTRMSRELLRVFTSSQYFILHPVRPQDNPQKLLDAERTKGVLIVEPGFGRRLCAGQSARVQVLLDGADNSITSTIMGYLEGIQRFAANKLLPAGAVLAPPIQLMPRFLFNPEQDSHWFVIPGLATVVIGILSIILTALTVAREYENGSMEMLLSTPVQPLEIILGKIAPYLGIVLISVGLIYLVARGQFGLPFRGNHLLFVLGVLLFLTLCLGQGILISVTTRQQMLAMQLSFISGLLPSLLLSGFIFPIESMPAFFQYFTFILPARWFMVISRGLFLKGAGLWELGLPFIMLTALNILLVSAAVKRFKKDLEP